MAFRPFVAGLLANDHPPLSVRTIPQIVISHPMWDFSQWRATQLFLSSRTTKTTSSF
jgi:hypothetical protein